MRSRQLNIFADKVQMAFGGSQMKSHPKMARTLSTRDAVHLVLRSDRARGEFSFIKKYFRADQIIRGVARKYGVRIYRVANAGNHFHIILKLRKRFDWKPFICELTSGLAALSGFTGRHFWSGRPFTRVIRGWGKNFHLALNYVLLNRLEAAGVLTRNERKIKLLEVNTT